MSADSCARLIVGHAARNSVRIWVRAAEAGRPIAFVTISSPGTSSATQSLRLRRRDDFTGVVEFSGLTANRQYHCEVAFAAGENTPPEARESPTDNQGRFRTQPAGSGLPLDFLFGSCVTPPRRKSSDESFRTLSTLAGSEGAAFMIHCGDQIYYPGRTAPKLEVYRRRYREAWGTEPARRFLGQLPHYMILDDHEILNNFSNDRRTPYGAIGEFKALGLRSYREYQHSHNPRAYGRKLYYRFDYGRVRFFVMDVRSERDDGRQRMIGPQQLAAFLEWLDEYRHDLKFVVTPVPFIVDFWKPLPAGDKWCGEPFKRQRGAILDFIGSQDIRPPVFLTGDLHCSYHAIMRLRRRSTLVTLHELMSSPISQKASSLGKGTRFVLNQRVELSNGWRYRTRFSRDRNNRPRFYNRDSNAMHIRVTAGRIRFRVHRLKKGETGPVFSGSFRPG